VNENDHHLIKEPATVALDEVARGTRELLEVYRLLAGDLEGHELRARLEGYQAYLSTALEQLIAARQAAGELPDAGDIEHAQWRSLGLRIKSLLSAEPEVAILLREAAAENRTLAEQIKGARAQHPSPAVLQALAQLTKVVTEQGDALERNASSRS